MGDVGRRAFLRCAAALAVTGTASAVIGRCSAWGQEPEDDKAARDFSVYGHIPLYKRASAKGLIYGSAIRRNIKDTEYLASFTKECGIIVPEGELRWNALRPSPDKFDFVPGDYLAAFAKQNNLLLRGHALVWHGALPKWFDSIVNKQNAEQVLRNHIATVVGHYAGRMHSWDVVNEVIAPWDKQPEGLRNSPWYKLLGDKYIDIAFRTAAKADPNAILVFNMDHLEYDIEEEQQNRAATLKFIKRLKSSGTPIHALGIQGHLNLNGGERFNPKIFKAFLRDAALLGLKIMITELDVTDKSFPGDVTTRDRMVAGKYEEFLSAALQEKAVIAVITWGLSDKRSWLSQFRPRADNAPVRPLPLDENFNRKLAWNAIAREFDKAPKR